ncbi:MAG: GNAT family N-acetyltransferase [Paracoccaceae bacterium]|nr:GNAT family N-acetyltransferase [Paracoccaceae bacterium]
MISITAESPTSPDGRILVDGSQIALLEVFPPEEIFTFSAEELATPDVTFLVAREAGQAIGCVAMVDCGDYAEVKRLYVPKEGRGKGLAKAMMATVEARARESGMTTIRLETGEALVSAVALYEALGFRRCGRFGDYADHPASLFMEKVL